MDDAGRVDVLETAQDLIHEELNVLVRQRLRLQDVVQVGAHQVGHKVPVIRRRGDDGDRLGAEHAGHTCGSWFVMYCADWFVC